MSDMSFKQAKEISERLELSELTLKSTLDKMEKSNEIFEETLEKQKELLSNECKKDNKIVNLKILIALNVGFIIGLLISKYFL